LHPGLKLNDAQRATLTAIATQMGLEDLLDRLPGQLSGGQRQRVALARCLVREQPVLLLDEPFSALDPALRQEMLVLVNEVCQRQNLTLLMVSHSVEDALRIAPRSLVIADGRIAWDGSTQALVSGQSPASALLGIAQLPALVHNERHVCRQAVSQYGDNIWSIGALIKIFCLRPA
ncbi:MAG: thiQ, partial [Enterobacter kobei]|nr:thiQ [Enterobacter kobei]